MARRTNKIATVITAADGYAEGLVDFANAAAEPAPKVRKKHVIKDRSKIDGPVSRVWGICAGMPQASRKDQVAACVAQGIALNTARTQSSLWAAAEKASAITVS